jgi:hypothetical protein
MAKDVIDVGTISERVFARADVLDACRNRDLGIVIDVLGHHGVTQGRIAGLTGISQGRLSEYKNHLRTPRATSVFEDFANGVMMPPAARLALGLSPGQLAKAGTDSPPAAGPPSDVGLAYPDAPMGGNRECRSAMAS